MNTIPRQETYQENSPGPPFGPRYRRTTTVFSPFLIDFVSVRLRRQKEDQSAFKIKERLWERRSTGVLSQAHFRHLILPTHVRLDSPMLFATVWKTACIHQASVIRRHTYSRNLEFRAPRLHQCKEDHLLLCSHA